MEKIHVAILNTSKEITEMLADVLKDEGFTTCEMFVYKFKNNEKTFDDFIKENKPQVILYDIAPPYRENYLFFRKLSKRKSVNSIPFILTSTNKDALESYVGPTKVHELIGKPYDLKEITDAVNNAYAKNLVII